jgi:Na+/melibiose symporter-like transporter
MTRNLQISLFAGMLAAAGLPLYIHLPRYAATELGLSLQAVGGLLIAIRVLDFAQDPLLGQMIDRFPAARGAFAAAAALGMGAGFAVLFSLRPGSGVLLWLGAALVLVFTAYSLGSILFYGQSTVFAGAGSELIRMAGFREAGALAGVILAAVAPGALLALGAPGYSAFGLLLAAVCLAVWAATRTLWHLPAAAGGSLSLPALRDAGAARLLLLALVNSLPVAITSTLFLFFVSDYLQLPGMAGPFLILFFLAAGLSVPLWTRACTLFGPRQVLVPAMTLAILSFLGAALLNPGAGAAFAAICLGSGAALGADMVILPVLFSTALSRAGLKAGTAFGLWSFAGKLSLACAAAALLPLLELSGFRPGAANSAAALTTLILAYAVLPCLIKLCAIALVFRLPQEVPQS